MNKQEKNKKRIDIIKEERLELLQEVRDNIVSGNKNVVDNVENIVSLLDHDEVNIKKYQSLKKAQELIESLTQEIINANDKEEIAKLRKKLNYYINKVKNEAQKRNIDCNEYSENVTMIRKDISKFIRFSKKIKQIEKLEEINNHYDQLDEEEKKVLQHQLTNAKSYNNRVQKEKMHVVKQENQTFELHDEEDIFEDKERRVIYTVKTYSSDEEFLTEKIDNFNKRYSISKTHEYNNGILKNIFNFILNLPIYGINKRRIRTMICDYMTYYGGDDLGLFIEYMRNNNSIKEGFKSIFSKSSLYNKENTYLNEHERCINWILSCMRANNINFGYVKAK